MNWVKIATALFGILITLMAASSGANATMLTIEDDDFGMKHTLSQPFEDARSEADGPAHAPVSAPMPMKAKAKSIFGKVWSDVTVNYAADHTDSPPPAERTTRPNSGRSVETAAMDKRALKGETRSILSRVLNDVSDERPTDAILLDKERIAAATFKAELQKELAQANATHERANSEPFERRQTASLGALPGITRTQGAGLSAFDGLMSGDGWASFIASDHFKRAKRKIVNSETRILQTIATLTNREAQAATGQPSKSKGGLLLGLASAFLLLVIVGVAAMPRQS